MWTELIETLDGIDRALFLFLNGLHSPFFDSLMYYISYKYTWIPFYVFLVALVIRQHKWKSVHFILGIVLLIAISDQGSVWIKDAVMRFRPCHDPELADLVHLVRGRCGGRFGFVSSHAANSFALATFMSLTFRDRYKWMIPLMITWAALKAYSRIYLGVHYPGDVIFGALLGVLIGLLVYQIWLWADRKVNKCQTKA
jgi:undecaprenyl-diphosphatase